MLTSAMKVEMCWPYFALTRFFARWHVDSYFNFSWVFVPAWDRCLADTSNACRRRCSVGIQMGVLSTGLAQIKVGRNESDMCVVQFDERGIEAGKN